MITRADVKKDIVPSVRTWLEGRGHAFDGRGFDEAGHEIYAFGEATHDRDAYVVYEGEPWTLDFIEDMDGGIEEGERVYELEAYTSY